MNDSGALTTMEGGDSRPEHDVIRPWFEASEALGDFIGIRFGHLAPSSGEPEWLYRSHASFDGIGGFADILRSRGVALPSLPVTPHAVDPSWRHFARSVPEYLQPRRRVSWKAPFASARCAAIDRPPEAVSWRVFERDASRFGGARASLCTSTRSSA
jgi:hypothetical protein